MIQEKYVTEEIPYMREQHREYVIKTQDPIPLNEFLEDHYTNWLSPWYKAEQYYKDKDPLKQHDGVIVTWENYKI